MGASSQLAGIDNVGRDGIRGDVLLTSALYHLEAQALMEEQGKGQRVLGQHGVDGANALRVRRRRAQTVLLDERVQRVGRILAHGRKQWLAVEAWRTWMISTVSQATL